MTSPLNLWRRAEQLKLASIDPTKSSNELWINRQSLQDIYQNLLIADLEFSLDKKVEQDLWNFAFKKQITTLQNQCKDKQNQKRGEVQAGLNLFLDAASGFYIQLLQEVCSSFTLDLPFRRRNRKYGIFKEYQTVLQKAKVPSKSSCLYLCQDCLVHLGDIARYKQCNDQAQTFYKHAAQLVPMNGQPYNQLAILEVQKGNKLSTIFYHTRSLAVQHPFPVAEINCNKFFARISKDGQDSRHKIVTNEWLSMFLQFLASVHLELDPMKSRIRLDRILLSFKPNLSSLGFNTQQLLQMVTILFYEYHSIIEKQLKNTGKGHSYLKPKEMHGLSSRMADGDKHFPPVDEEEEEDDDEFAENDGKTSKRGILPGVQLNEKELEEVYKKRINMVLELTGSMMESIFMAANEKEGELRELLLPVIKMMLDWLISNEDVVNHPIILKSGLWTMLCLLANDLIGELNKLGVDKNFLESHEGMPLPEDRELQCFLPLKKAHCRLNFTWRNCDSVPQKDEKVLRVRRILDNCTLLQEMAEKSQGKSAGILTAKYTSGAKKALVSFETNVPKNKLDVSASTPAVVERRPARLNVALQTILQKSTSEGRAGERSEGDGECAGKQSKRSLKVEFKEEVENVWKEMNSDGSQDQQQQPQVVDRNNNNSPHMLQNFCARPFPMYPSMPCPPTCYGPPLRAPMYQFYPLPPPPPLPFAFRPGCPLPAPPSMVPRFNPMPSLEISVTSSDSTLSDVSSKCSSKVKGESAPLLPLSVETEFPCLPSRKDHQLPAPKRESPRPLTSPATLVMPKMTVKQDIKRDYDNGAQKYPQAGPCPFPSFQPMHPPSFPRAMLNHPPNAGMPFMPPQQLPRPSGQPPFGRPMMPSNYSPYPQVGQQQQGQQPCSFYQSQDFQDRPGQNFKAPKEDVVTIPPQSSGGCPDNPFRLGGFSQVQNMTGAGMRPNTNKCDSLPCRNDQSTVNIYGAQFNNHSLAPPNVTPNFDMRMQRPPSAANMTQPCPNYQFQPDQSRMGFGQPQPEMDQLTQDANTFRPECNNGRNSQQFNMNVVSFNEPETNCIVPPLPPSAWAASAKSSDCNTAEKGFDVRLCAQRALGRFTGPLNFSNCNNSSSEGKPGENVASSYNLFGQAPWSPVLVNNKGSDGHFVNSLSVQRDRMTRATLPSVNKPESDGPSANGSWKELPSPANQALLGQILIMKSTNNVLSGSNAHQSTAWSGHPTPLEKLLQQQKQLRPNGN